MALTDFSWITSFVLSLAKSAFFWASLVIIGLIVFIVTLKMKRKKRLKIPVFKVVDLGNNKLGLNGTKAGYFKKNKTFFGLWEKGGEEELITKDEEVIYGATPNDYQEVDFQRTLFVTPSIDDPKILIPLSKLNISKESRSILMDIAPIEIREAAVDAHKKTIKEMKDMKEQIVQWIIIGMFFIVAFLVILFITQYGKHMVDKAAEMQAGSQDTLKQIGQKLVDAVNAQHAVNSPISSGAP